MPPKLIQLYLIIKGNTHQQILILETGNIYIYIVNISSIIFIFKIYIVITN